MIIIFCEWCGQKYKNPKNLYKHYTKCPIRLDVESNCTHEILTISYYKFPNMLIDQLTKRDMVGHLKCCKCEKLFEIPNSLK